MNLFSALSALLLVLLLLLLDSQEVGSQSFSLLQQQQQQGGGNPVNPPSSSSRWLLSSSSWVKAASFSSYLDDYDEWYIIIYCLAISGDGSFIGLALEADSTVLFFQKQQDGSWNEMINLRLTTNANDGDHFGSDISLSEDGKRVAIGASYDAGVFGEFWAGSFSVYEMNSDGSGWSLMGDDVIHGKSENSRSGSSVALSKNGSIVAMGAPGNDGTIDYASFSGHVRVFRWDAAASAFHQMGGDIVGGPGRDGFGFPVAISKDGLVVAIGASDYEDENMLYTGRVHVYYWDESDGEEKKWSRRGSTINADSTDGWFGTSIDLSGDGNILAVGAPLANSAAGEAQVFQWKDGDWVKLGQTLKGTVEYFRFGKSVSLSSDGSILAVGSGDGLCDNFPNHPVMVFTLVDNQWEGLGGAVSGTAGQRVSLSSNGETIAFGYPED
eukprot:scaffold9544_cov97-Cylindrotheca_fusiformis.AAC.1